MENAGDGGEPAAAATVTAKRLLVITVCMTIEEEVIVGVSAGGGVSLISLERRTLAFANVPSS